MKMYICCMVCLMLLVACTTPPPLPDGLHRVPVNVTNTN
jgi:hypothetical protein